MESSQLFAALSKAQSEMKPAILDMTNPHYRSKYASLSSVVDAIKAPLAKNGLSIVQCVENEGDEYFLRTILAHASGEKVESRLKLLIGKRDMQGLGSAITYARRYSISSMLGVVDTEDDDGNDSLPQKTEVPKSKPKASKPPEFEDQFGPTKADLLAELYSVVDAKGIDPVLVKEIIFEVTGEKLRSDMLTETQILSVLRKIK